MSGRATDALEAVGTEVTPSTWAAMWLRQPLSSPMSLQRPPRRPGEDGTVQGMLDLMGLKYTHSGLVTSNIAIDKELTKQALVPPVFPCRPGTMVDSENLVQPKPPAAPYVLETINEGSSVGVAIVRTVAARQPHRARRMGPARVSPAARRGPSSRGAN